MLTMDTESDPTNKFAETVDVKVSFARISPAEHMSRCRSINNDTLLLLEYSICTAFCQFLTVSLFCNTVFPQSLPFSIFKHYIGIALFVRPHLCGCTRSPCIRLRLSCATGYSSPLLSILISMYRVLLFSYGQQFYQLLSK